jgi:hypothetical protein
MKIPSLFTFVAAQNPQIDLTKLNSFPNEIILFDRILVHDKNALYIKDGEFIKKFDNVKMILQHPFVENTVETY